MCFFSSLSNRSIISAYKSKKEYYYFEKSILPDSILTISLKGVLTRTRNIWQNRVDVGQDVKIDNEKEVEHEQHKRNYKKN